MTRAYSFVDLAVGEVPEAGLDGSVALEIATRAAADDAAATDLLALAGAVRERQKPDEIAFCGILQAKIGGCPENCGFCNQSVHHGSLGGLSRPLVDERALFTRAQKIASMGGRAFSIVTAGRRLSGAAELNLLCRVVERVRQEVGLECCASLGRLDRRALRQLRSAGLQRYHHNLEAAPSFFPQVITSYKQERSLETIAAARDEGLSICSAGVFGLGETDAHRVELLELLQMLHVEGAPLCFLEPHPATPFADQPLLDPDEALRIIALHRLMLPWADVIVAGGRLLVLGERQGDALNAGANGLMVGDYPTDFDGELERDHEISRARGLLPRRPLLR